ncbi:MAG: hypothetical protein Q9209_004778 [Squamulea sp. 1 TL-2023]
MQSEGIELGKVFPSAMSSKASCKASSRELLGTSVQGLAVFNEHQWRTQSAPAWDVPDTCKDLLSQLFAQGGTLAPKAISEQVEPGAWWKLLSDEVHVPKEETKDFPQPSTQHSSKNVAQPGMVPGDPGFLSDQRRLSTEEFVLPQRGINPQNDSPKTLDGGSTTDTSDDDLDSVQAKPKEPTSIIPTRQSSNSSNSSSPERLTEANKSTPPKSMGLLGRIGGASNPSNSPSKPTLGQIGVIGKTLRAPSEAPSESRAQQTNRTKSPGLPRETSPERADRKREQLKRELEEKSKAGVKKKRKF